MFKNIIKYLGSNKNHKDDFSQFFRSATENEKKELILEAVRKANKEQRELVNQYRKLHPKTP